MDRLFRPRPRLKMKRPKLMNVVESKLWQTINVESTINVLSEPWNKVKYWIDKLKTNLIYHESFLVDKETFFLPLSKFS